MISPQTLSIAVMAAGFLAIAIIERPPAGEAASGSRLIGNFGLGVVNGILAFVIPVGTLAAALASAQSGFGLLHRWPAPWWLAIPLLLIIRSLATYGVHRLSHAVPWLWRIHRVHHSDAHCDLSTSFRSHPVEVLVTLPVAVAVTALIAPSVPVLVATETLLLTVAMWEHGDFTLPARIERLVGSLVATPAQHRLHHSIDPAHRDCNFGDTLILWDRLFETYREGEAERFGVADCPPGRGLPAMLAQPFHSSR